MIHKRIYALQKQLYLLGHVDLAHELMRDLVLAEHKEVYLHIYKKADSYLTSKVMKAQKKVIVDA